MSVFPNKITGACTKSAARPVNINPSDPFEVIGHIVQAHQAQAELAKATTIDTKPGLTGGIGTRSPARATHFHCNLKTAYIHLGAAETVAKR